ncbi:MAG: sigma-70 family RNA polymerase sigma factor [candidate division Zixibacteria bacterium]|nr:sigma-70 family RNA polymerase sigma factor [candidate division Zixibacteria bacterium]
MSEKTGAAFNINILYADFLNGDKTAENKLLSHLTVSFRLFTKHKIWDEHDSEEIVQDALMTIIDKCRKIEFEASFAVWAYRVLNNKIMNYVTTKQTRKRLTEQHGSFNNRPSYQCHNVELKIRLKECFNKINKINSDHARILNLKYQGYSTDEICKILKITRNNMYVKLSRARTALEICLKKGDNDNE